MKVLLTGVEGYIGCVLADVLSRDGFEVTGLDTGYYREGWLFSNRSVQSMPRTLFKDIRQLDASDLAGFDAVVHLAELSNDPLGEHDPEVTFDINHKGSVHLAELAKQAGVRRFVYTSSCSVYGVADAVVDENSPTNPQTAYAKCKVLVEQEVGAMTHPDFTPTFLRNATAYGASPRMRFDIVLNNLAGLAWTTKRIAMTSDGSPWRPLVHIRDIASAVVCTLRAPSEIVSGEVFNVGSTSCNYRIREIAEVVGQVFPGCEVTFGPPSGDNRSYKVNFDKIAQQLPGFETEWDVMSGARELLAIFSQTGMTENIFEHRAFTRIKSLQYLRKTSQIDERFYWVA